MNRRRGGVTTVRSRPRRTRAEAYGGHASEPTGSPENPTTVATQHPTTGPLRTLQARHREPYGLAIANPTASPSRTLRPRHREPYGRGRANPTPWPWRLLRRS